MFSVFHFLVSLTTLLSCAFQDTGRWLIQRSFQGDGAQLFKIVASSFPWPPENWLSSPLEVLTPRLRINGLLRMWKGNIMNHVHNLYISLCTGLRRQKHIENLTHPTWMLFNFCVTLHFSLTNENLSCWLSLRVSLVENGRVYHPQQPANLV